MYLKNIHPWIVFSIRLALLFFSSKDLRLGVYKQRGVQGQQVRQDQQILTNFKQQKCDDFLLAFWCLGHKSGQLGSLKIRLFTALSYPTTWMLDSLFHSFHFSRQDDPSQCSRVYCDSIVPGSHVTIRDHKLTAINNCDGGSGHHIMIPSYWIPS